MNLLFRIIWVLLGARRRPRLNPLDESVISLRVLPNDLDLHAHMNNGRYLSIMDLGRLDLMARTGLGRVALERRWIPLVAWASIRYRRPLKLFQKFNLRTRIVYWDTKWFYIEQRFEHKGQLIAAARVMGLLRGKSGNIASHDALHLLGHGQLIPPAGPSDLDQWGKQ